MAGDRPGRWYDRTRGCPRQPQGELAGRRDQLRRNLPDAAEVETTRRRDRDIDRLGPERRALGNRDPYRAVESQAVKEPGKSDRVSKEIFRSEPNIGLSSRFAATPPAVSNERRDWARNPIDRFILAALEAKDYPRPDAEQADADSPGRAST